MNKIDPTKIKAKHERRVIIYNGRNGLMIEGLKELSDDFIEQKKKFYDKRGNFIFFSGGYKFWRRKNFLIGYLLVGILLLIIGGSDVKIFGILIVGYSLFRLGEKQGHRVGYFDGYEIGSNDGIDKALGIDDEDKKMIEAEENEWEDYKNEVEFGKLLREKGAKNGNEKKDI